MSDAPQPSPGDAPLADRVARLEQSLAELHARLDRWERAPAQPSPRPTESPSVAGPITPELVAPEVIDSAPRPARSSDPVRPGRVPGSEPAPSSPAPPRVFAPPPGLRSADSAPSATPRRPARAATGDLEAQLGGQVFTWAGALVLLFALGFGIHWAWTTFETPPEVQVAAIHLLGLALVTGAGFIGRRSQISRLGEGLTGLGLFTLYAAALATLRLYRLTSEPVAFAEFLAITVAAIALSWWWKSPGVILLGALGGYLAPILTSSGSGDHVVLFLYLAALNVALYASAIVQGWNWLKPLGLAAAAGYLIIWLEEGYGPEHRTSTAWLVALHAILAWVAGTAPTLLYRRPSSSFDAMVLPVASLGGLAVWWGLYHEVPEVHLGRWACALAVVHGLAFYLARGQVGLGDRLTRVLLGLGVAFAVWAVPLELDDHRYLGLLWCAEGLIFSLIGLRFADPQMRASGILVLLLGLARIFLSDYRPAGAHDDTAWYLNRAWWTVLGGAVFTALAGLAEWLLPGRTVTSVQRQQFNRLVAGGLLALANLVFLAALATNWTGRTLLILITCDVAFLWALGFWVGAVAARWYAACLGVGLAGGLAVVLGDRVDEPFLLLANSRFASLAWLAVVYGLAGWAYWKLPPATGSAFARLTAGGLDRDDERRLHLVLGTLAHLLLVFALTLEVQSWFREARVSLSFSWADERMARLASYSVLWAVYAALLVAAGFVWRYPLYRWLGLVAFGPILLKVFLVDLAELELLPRVLAFAVLGMMLLGTSLLYQRYAARLVRE